LRHSIPQGDLAPILEQALDLLIADVKTRRFGIGAKARANDSKRPERSATAMRNKPSETSAAVMENKQSDRPTAVLENKSSETSTAAAENKPSSDTSRADSSATPAKSPSIRNASRHIPKSFRRAIFERDGGQCTFVSEGGRRCGEKAWLEFDHLDGFALTGEHSVERITLRCHAHNQLGAERLYGLEWMEAARGKFTRFAADKSDGALELERGADGA
jgi:hypothetical protein